jgi:hypothetical protein
MHTREELLILFALFHPGVTMNAVTRWKTIATIAIAFSAGNLFSTACQNAGSGKANAEDGTTEDGGDGSTPPPDLSSVEADVASIKCFIGHMTDDQFYNDYDDELQDYGDRYPSGNTPWEQGWNSDSSKAYEDCF